MSGNSTGTSGGDSSVSMSTAGTSASVGDSTPGTNGSVSIAYASGNGMGRQHPLNNVANLFHLGVQNAMAQLDALFGDEAASSSSTAVGASDGDGEDNNGKDRKVSCYCLPCLTFGRGEEGRANVRLISTLFFPLFLLSFFLLDDLGRGMMRTIRLRNGISQGHVTVKQGHDDKIEWQHITRKTIQDYPKVKREIIWVPLEHTLNLDGGTRVKAKMQCPRGVLFLFHGCGRYAASFFYSPQGRRIVSSAYKAGISIVAFEKDEEKGCWEWETDGIAVLKTGRKFMKSRVLGACGTNENGEQVYPPIYAFGASSGGSFIAQLASEMEEDREKWSPFLFNAINVQIMPPPERLDWNTPSIFTVMEGDAITKQLVEERVSKKFQGGPFKMIVTSGRKGIHPHHFSELYSDDTQMTPQLSSEIYRDLVDMSVIDPANGDALTSDPRQMGDAVASVWEKYDYVARAATATATGTGEEVYPFGMTANLMRPLRADELYDANSIWLIEELNVAWDQHEITAEGFDEVLRFFLENGGPR